MRIVFVAWAGSEHTRRWAGFFAARGHEVHVVTCGDGAAGSGGAGYAVHDLGRPRLGKAGYLAKLPAARRTIRSLAPHLVHAHYVTSYGLLALASGRRPLVLTAHGSDVLVSPRNPFMRALVRRVLRAASLITIPGEHMREAIDALLGGVDRPVLVLQYGVEVDRLAALGDRLGDVAAERRRPLRIVSVRHLLPLYGVDLLLQALAELRAGGLEFSCDIVGGGPERAPLERLTRDLSLDDCVVFHGAVPSAAAEEAMARADVYVSVPASDGLSISLLEALAIGVVPVLSDIPANRGWVEEGSSGAYATRTAEGVADGILRASRLDRATATRRNRELVRARADRATNLGRLERALLDLVG